MRDELRGARLQLEFLKPDLLMRDRGIAATVVVFGSARIPAPEDAAARLAEAERQAAENPDDPEAARRLRTMQQPGGEDPLLRRSPAPGPDDLRGGEERGAGRTPASCSTTRGAWWWSPAAARASWRPPTGARTTSARTTSA